jgi:hypothetical protein
MSVVAVTLARLVSKIPMPDDRWDRKKKKTDPGRLQKLKLNPPWAQQIAELT